MHFFNPRVFIVARTDVLKPVSRGKGVLVPGLENCDLMIDTSLVPMFLKIPNIMSLNMLLM